MRNLRYPSFSLDILGSDPTPISPLTPSTVVSLFSGCGGMDLGFMGGFYFGKNFYEKLPFRIIWANDLNKHACRTYQMNFSHPIHTGALFEVLATLPQRADIVMGGFPCQDVSVNGSRKGAGGKRTILYKEMINIIARLRPQAFIAENVKGLAMSHSAAFFQSMLADFRCLPGYTLDHHIYLAADYGVPQMRERIFIIGMKEPKVFRPPLAMPTHMSAQEALQDLEECPEDRGTSHIWSRAKLSPGQGSRKLTAHLPSSTIRAESHGNQQWYYHLPRRISLREAARLQSFPDDFVFPGGMRESERQIGNAVPPVLAWYIAKALYKQLSLMR